MEYFLIYIAVASAAAIVITCYDKIAAKKLPHHRVSEKLLLFIAALGGSAAMYITMRCIRHKTLHKKFMLGIPAIFILQLAAAAAWFFYTH